MMQPGKHSNEVCFAPGLAMGTRRPKIFRTKESRRSYYIEQELDTIRVHDERYIGTGHHTVIYIYTPLRHQDASRPRTTREISYPVSTSSRVEHPRLSFFVFVLLKRGIQCFGGCGYMYPLLIPRMPRCPSYTCMIYFIGIHIYNLLFIGDTENNVVHWVSKVCMSNILLHTTPAIGAPVVATLTARLNFVAISRARKKLCKR